MYKSLDINCLSSFPLKYNPLQPSLNPHPSYKPSGERVTYDNGSKGNPLLIFLMMVFLSFVCWVPGMSQHLTVSNFYPVNQYMVNPAFMNEDEKIALYLSGRNHWASLDGSPMDLYFGLNYPFMDKTSGGIRLTGDKQGIFNTYLTEMTYAYKLRFNRNHALNLGLAAGFETFRLNRSDIYTGTITDPVLEDENYNETDFSTGIGLYYVYNDLFVSAALPAMLKHEELYQTVYGSVGYNLTVLENPHGEVLGFQPSASIHSIPASPVQYDFNIITRIRDLVYVQTSYVTNASFITGLGIDYNDFYLGYAYEFSIGELSHMSKGSHEVMLSYRFESAGGWLKGLFGEREKPGAESRQAEAENQSMENIFEKYRAKQDESYSSFYVVVGAYYELKDAVDFRDLLMADLDLDVEIMEREDGKYFFVYTDQFEDRKEARQRAISLNQSELKDYIRGNVWLYGEK